MSSKKKTITASERLQVIGLLALAEHHTRTLRDIEGAVLAITQETDHNGELYAVWGGGHVNDAIGGSYPGGSADDLLRLIGLTVEAPDGE